MNASGEQLLEAARTILPPGQLRVFELFAAGISQRTIALILGLHRSTVRDHLEEANRALQQHFERESAA